MVIRNEKGERLVSTYPPQQQESESIAPQQRAEKGGDPRENVPPVTVEVPPRPEGPQPPRRSRKSRRQGQECRDRWKLGVEIFTAVIVLAYTTVAALQWCVTREANQIATRANADSRKATADALQETEKGIKIAQATQRAAVYLGLPDSKVIELIPEEDNLLVRMYFRNYGALTAHNMIVERWPIVTSSDRQFFDINVPPFPVTSPNRGPDIPPGFPKTENVRIYGLVQNEVETGQVSLRIVGRISYSDSFGSHCDSFSATYFVDVKSFDLTPTQILCDGKSHEIHFCNIGNGMMIEMEDVGGPGPPLKFGCGKAGAEISRTPQQEESNN